MSYGTFLMGELARAKNVIDKELEYDLMFETIQAMYNDFNNSTFSLADKSEYDCIVDYLNHISNLNETVTPTNKVILGVLGRIETETKNFDSTFHSLPLDNKQYVDIITNVIKKVFNLPNHIVNVNEIDKM